MSAICYDSQLLYKTNKENEYVYVNDFQSILFRISSADIDRPRRVESSFFFGETHCIRIPQGYVMWNVYRMHLTKFHRFDEFGSRIQWNHV